MNAGCFNAMKIADGGRIPIISGIVYNDGNIDCLRIVDDDSRFRAIVKGNRIHINEYLKNNRGSIFSCAFVVFKTMDKHNIVSVSCGEGLRGSEGFIAVESLDNNAIVWMASFHNSSSFVRVEIIDNMIYAVNILGEIWAFAVNDPGSASIVKQIKQYN